ncbi:MAG: glycoside hydrolase TIM-barrel-like domain-containing protein [Pseudomonadota bacterium]
MGEIILTPVGSLAGAALVPNGIHLFGQSISGAAIGSAVGQYFGQAIDDALLPPVEAPRIKSLHIMESREGAPLAKVYGRMRLGGQVIWASRFREARRQQTVSKGGPDIIDYSYSISFAVALCQGPITRLDRVWANGELLALRDLNWRLYLGAADQMPDPLIEAIEGTGQAPAYRNTAYIVFEDFPLDAFGQRIPQMSFEVVRAGDRQTDALATTIAGVNIIPASGEFVYATSVVRERRFPAIETTLNLNNACGDADFAVSLDQLRHDLPNVQAAALTVAWFGDDLRAGTCRLRPGVEQRDRTTVPYAWQVDQTDRQAAHLISQTEGSPNFGGTPADAAVLEAIAALKAAGMAVTLSPFLLMDVPEGNGLPDPRGWIGQPAFPWRGRITVTTDTSASARTEIEAFVGEDGGFGFRHFILHHARLAAAAGGVDAILIGSEMIGLTRVRDEAGRFPFVEALRAIATEVRAIVGAEVSLSYAADWTEYGAYAPGDGSQDVLFPLDELWASPDVDFVGVDWYPPMGDWRDGADHLDVSAGYAGADAPDYLQAQLAGGEAFDWYYASDADRDQQLRRPIIDGASGEHWVFRAKDLAGWWGADHHPRPGGIRSSTPTAWRAGLKPIRILEIGIPAIDKGANAPNVFVDPKSSESALPHFSNGLRDDLIQRRALSVAVAYWQDQPFIEQVLVWAWDGRPWPDFPAREDVWSDGPNWQFGHWLNGRTSLMELADIVDEMASDAGIDIETSGLNGVVDGYAVENVTSLASALSFLSLAFDFQLRESEQGLIATHFASQSECELDRSRLLERGQSERRYLSSQRPSGIALSYVAGDFSYQPATSLYRDPAAVRDRIIRAGLPLVLAEGRAEQLAESLYQRALATDQMRLEMAPGEAFKLEPGDAMTFDERLWRVAQIEDRSMTRQLWLRPHVTPSERARAITVPDAGAVAIYPADIEYLIIAVPDLLGDGRLGPAIAVSADPWHAPVAVRVGATLQSLQTKTTLRDPALIGQMLTDLPAGVAGAWDQTSILAVTLPGGDLSSTDPAAVLDGVNRLLVTNAGGWEVIGWRDAELVAPDQWHLSGLWRGARQTAAIEAAAGASVVLLDDRVQTLPLDPDQIGVPLLLQVGNRAVETLVYTTT